MRKKLYANASPPGRDLANKELLNELLKEPYTNSIDNSLRATKSKATKSLEQQRVLEITLRRMSPAYKKAKAQSIADPLAHRMKKVTALLRRKLSTDNFLQTLEHLDGLSPLDQVAFCDRIEKLYRE